MPEDKGIGSKILGLFVEMDAAKKDGPPPDDDAPAAGKEKSPAELVAELAAQSRAPVGAPAARGPTVSPGAPPAELRAPVGTGPAVAPAKVDFDQVFRGAGLDPGELDRVRKAEELLRSLPEATPHDIKRQIVEASLKAFGVDVQKIAGAAQNQLKALDTWVRINEQGTAKAISEAQQQIAQLEDRVIGLRAEITKKTEQLAGMAAAADVRKAEVGRVLQFFAGSPPSTPTDEKTT